MSSHLAAVHHLFGLSAPCAAPSPEAEWSLALPAGSITLITGPSGSGKTRLMQRLCTENNHLRWINPSQIDLPDRPVVDCLHPAPLPAVLRRLARVGLAEAWTCLRRPAELSEGERWRLRLALALHHAQQANRPTALVCDEFAAVLDRVTACVVARSLRRIVNRSPNLRALCATSHDDLMLALSPDQRIVCDFGQVHAMHARQGRAS